MNIDRNTRTPARLLMALPIAALALSLAACGGPVERPSAEAVAKGLQKQLESQGMGDALNDKVVLCISEALVESDTSNETLDAIARGDDKALTTQDDYKTAEAAIKDSAVECASKG